jgi:hypothetical protein
MSWLANAVQEQKTLFRRDLVAGRCRDDPWAKTGAPDDLRTDFENA